MTTVRTIANLFYSTVSFPTNTQTDASGIPSSFGKRNVICRDPLGRLWVVYTTNNNTGSLTVSYSDDMGQNWTVDANIDNGFNSIALSSQIAIDPTNLQPVIFGCDQTLRVVRYSKRNTAGVWSAWATASTDQGSLTGSPIENNLISCCVDYLGKIHIIFSTSSLSNGNIWYTTDVSGAFTTTAIWTDSAGTQLPMGFIAADRIGFVHLLFFFQRTSAPAGGFIRYIKKTTTDSFPELNTVAAVSPVEQIVSVTTAQINSASYAEMDMAIDHGGNPHVCWMQLVAGDEGEIYYAGRSTGAWVVELVESDSAREHFSPSIAVPQDGKVRVSWQEQSKSGGTVDNEVVIAIRNSGWTVSTFSVAGDNDCWPNLLHHQLPYIGGPSGISGVGYMGVYCDFDAVTGDFDYKLFFSDDWEPFDSSSISPEGPPAYATPTNYASIVLQGEGTPIATYPLTPYFAVPSSPRWVSERRESDGGWETTFPIAPKPRRIWAVHHDAMTAAEALVLQSFIETVKGPKSTFWFMIPDAQTPIVARLVEVVSPIIKLASGVYATELLVEEAFQ